MPIHVNSIVGTIKYSEGKAILDVLGYSGVSESQLNYIIESVIQPLQKELMAGDQEIFVVHKTFIDDIPSYYIIKFRELIDDSREFQIVIIDEAAFALLNYDPYFLDSLFDFNAEKSKNPRDLTPIIDSIKNFAVPDSMGDLASNFVKAFQALLPPETDLKKALKVILDKVLRKENLLLVTPMTNIINDVFRGLIYLMPRQLRKDYSLIIGLSFPGEEKKVQSILSFAALDFSNIDKFLGDIPAIDLTIFEPVFEERVSLVTDFVTELFPKIPSTLFARAKKLEEVLDSAGKIDYDYELLNKYVTRNSYLDEIGTAISEERYEEAISLYFKVLELDHALGVDYAKNTIDGLRNLLTKIEDDNLKKNTLLHILEVLKDIPEFSDIAMDVLESGLNTISTDEIKAIFITSYMDRVRANVALIVSSFELLLTYLDERISIVLATHTFGYLNEYLLNLVRRDKAFENVLNELWRIYITYLVRKSLIGAITSSFRALLVNQIIENIKSSQVAAAFEHVMQNVIGIINEVFSRENVSEDIRTSVFSEIGKGLIDIGKAYIDVNRDYLIGLPFYIDGLNYLTDYEDASNAVSILIEKLNVTELSRISPIRLIYDSLVKLFSFLKKFNLKELGSKLLTIAENLMFQTRVLDKELYITLIEWYILTRSREEFNQFLDRTIALIKGTDLKVGIEVLTAAMLFLSRNNFYDLATLIIRSAISILPTKELPLLYQTAKLNIGENLERYRDLLLVILSELEKEYNERNIEETLSSEDCILLYNALYEAYAELDIKDKQEEYSKKIRELILSAPLTFTPDNVETLKVVIERTLTTKEYLKEYVTRKANYLKSLIESQSLDPRRKYGEAVVQITSLIPRIESLLEEEYFASVVEVLDILIQVANKVASYDPSLGITAYDALLRFLVLQIKHGTIVWKYFKEIAKRRFKIDNDLKKHIQLVKLLVDSISSYKVKDVPIEDIIKYCDNLIKDAMKRKDILLASALVRSLIFNEIFQDYLIAKPKKEYYKIILKLLDINPDEALRILLASKILKYYAQKFSDFRKSLERRLMLLRKTFIYRDQVIRVGNEYNLRISF
ncbi:MAG: hypothetical protein ACP6IS_00535 [Candidatus Asgardarchaeia archaeon]